MATLKTQIERLVRDLRQITKWGRMADFAAVNGLPITRTWDPFLAAILERYTSDEDLLKVVEKLKSFYIEQLLAADRMVTFFHPSVEHGKSLYDVASNAQPPESAAKAHFPALVPEAQAKDEVPQVPTFVGRLVSHDKRVALFYLSGRYVEERDKYKRDEVNAAVQEAFQDYDEFIAIKLKFKQCMDSVIVYPDGSVQLRMDLPTLTNVDYAEICIKSLLSHFHADFPGAGGTPFVGDRVNLFRAIGNIYRTAGLGRVSELGFETPTDSVKVEKMRDRSSDLREELYHKAGKVGLKDLAEIVPYRLSVRFSPSSGKHPVELSLPGSFRELAKPSQRLEVASVSGCLYEKDFEAAVQTLLGHV
ncbi:hypothetical protein LGN06_20535 [Burkholderia vietnamiensis]|uniref:hypothetical protein n=1 Tax=Burkholderia vietnamiensis TaxID=60552 RepID=UPI001CF48B05|nr:hypothetical protein [Burkholderia vietnamiensis]MCA8393944.1 hypothetical protein [Burkholderia vietnamiensis]HDR8961655.1 hypothetical protein [Burkholderia vietnamiensis]HDR9244701.1 hypothetical protein [Burkholderia vietnamiensis]